jgi:hypothetical protein
MASDRRHAQPAQTLQAQAITAAVAGHGNRMKAPWPWKHNQCAPAAISEHCNQGIKLRQFG